MNNVEGDISKLMRTRFKNKSGIIYCFARKDCERLNEVLKRNYGIKCDYYHADIQYVRR